MGSPKVERYSERDAFYSFTPDAALLRSHRSSSRVPFPLYFSSSFFSLYNNCNFSIPPFRILVFSCGMRRIDTNTGGTPKIGRMADGRAGREASSKPPASLLCDLWIEKVRSDVGHPPAEFHPIYIEEILNIELEVFRTIEKFGYKNWYRWKEVGKLKVFRLS